MCQDLIQLYSDIDSLIRRYELQFQMCSSCNADCCRAYLVSGDPMFPFITPKEKHLIENYLNGRVSWSPSIRDNILICGFIDNNGCSVYQWRPIDCRMYHCDLYRTEEYILFHNESENLKRVYFERNPEELERQISMINYRDI